MLSIDDRLDAASGEIERLHGQIDAVRNAILRAETRQSVLLNALKVLRNVRTTGELAWAHKLADAAIAKEPDA